MITVELFAAFAEFAGARKIEIEYRDGLNCEQVWANIAERFPKIRGIRPLYAIDDEYVQPQTLLSEGQTLFLFPPVSGG